MMPHFGSCCSSKSLDRVNEQVIQVARKFDDLKLDFEAKISEVRAQTEVKISELSQNVTETSKTYRKKN